MARRILNLLFCLVLLVMSACGTDSPQSILDGGASDYSSGKTEESYYFAGSGALLDELIDKYSGSYYHPTGTAMTDDEHDDKKAKESEETGDDTQPSYDGSDREVANMTDLMRLFNEAYSNTSDHLEFTSVNGFTLDINNDLQDIYTQLQRDDPIDVSGVDSWSVWNSGTEYYISINYSFDVDTLKNIKKETEQLINEAAAKINADGLSDYEIVYEVNEYLCDTVYYPPDEPYEPITHTAYGALKDGCAVCEGYACAAKLLLSYYGVECDIEVGYCLNGGGHAWNLVKLDGAWYQLDITWNDQSAGRDDYFLVTDDYMKQSRTWTESDYPVSSTSPYKP